MRTLAIDLGTRRVGLALSDSGGKFASPLDVLFVHGEQQAVDPIVKIIREEGVERIVVGLPLNMDDSLGPAARQASTWGRRLAETTGIPVLFVDDRLSSFEAEQQMNDRKRSGEKMTRKQKKSQLDAAAAVVFLQAFLDGRLDEIHVDDP